MPRVKDAAPTMSDAKPSDLNRTAPAVRTDHNERNILVTIAPVVIAETFALAWLNS
jgi:hypothetical protein